MADYSSNALARRSIPWTKSDTAVIPENQRPTGLSLDTAGAVAFVYEDGSTDTVTLAAGVIHPIAGVKQIMSTNTTASGFHLWKQS